MRTFAFECHIVVAQLCLTLCNPTDCSTPGFLSFTTSWTLLKFMSIESVMLSSHFILCRPLLFLPSVFPSIRVFSVSQLFASGGQSIEAQASASIPSMNIQGWFPLGLTGLIPLLTKGFSRVYSSTTAWKHQFFGAQPFLWSSSHIRMWLLEKP